MAFLHGHPGLVPASAPERSKNIPTVIVFRTSTISRSNRLPSMIMVPFSRKSCSSFSTSFRRSYKNLFIFTPCCFSYLKFVYAPGQALWLQILRSAQGARAMRTGCFSTKNDESRPSRAALFCNATLLLRQIYLQRDVESLSCGSENSIFSLKREAS